MEVDKDNLHKLIAKRVIDKDGKRGRIMHIYDIHNVMVGYLKGGTGLYCLDKDCFDYDELKPIP